MYMKICDLMFNKIETWKCKWISLLAWALNQLIYIVLSVYQLGYNSSCGWCEFLTILAGKMTLQLAMYLRFFSYVHW